jgi:hypothetical protein
VSRVPPDESGSPLLRAELRPDDRDEPHRVTGFAGEVVLLEDDDRLVAALVGDDRGRGQRVELAGRQLARRGPAGRVRAGLAVVRGTEVAPDVSVRDHLAGATDHRRAAELLASSPLLVGRGDDPAGVLSGGERRVLGWLLAVGARPRAVVLDRAGTGLDETTLRWAHRQLDRWLDDGVAVVLRPGRPEERRWATHRADGRPRGDVGPDGTG